MKDYKLETRLALLSINRPWMVIITSVLTVFLMAFGAHHITVSSDYRYFFGEDNPQRIAFENLQNVYSRDDSVLMTITPEDGKVFKKQTLAGLRYLTEKAWLLPFTTRVDSPTNFQYSYSEDDDLIVKDLVTEDDIEGIDHDYAKIQSIALAEPLLRNRIVNNQASVAGVNIRMTFPGRSPFEVPNAAQKARDLAQDFKQNFPGHSVHLTGMVMLNDAFNEAGIRDVVTLMPLMYLLIFAMLFFFLRNIAAVAVTLGVMLLAIVGAMGFSGWASIPITPPSSIAPTVIMTLAIAHSIHLLKALFKTMANGANKQDAIIESMRQNLRPIFLTSLTTVIGFLSLNFSDTPPFHDLGNITAVGVALAFILSIGFLPAIMSLAPIKAPKRHLNQGMLARRFTSWVERRSGAIILTTVFLCTFLALQISQIRINDQFVGYFDPSIQFRPHSEYTIEHLTGIYQLNFDIKSGKSEGIADPAYLQILDQFVEYLRSLDSVVHVASITDIFKRLNMNMHNDAAEFYRLPEARDLAAQYLLLYEMSLPYGLDLNNQINVSKSSSRVVVTLEELSTAEILQISDMASAWLEQHAPAAMQAQATSPTVMFSHITERNIHSMLWGTLIAFTLITITMIVALKSVKFGLISLLPNIIPATLAVGIWALLYGEAGFSIAFVASVTLGIIVDDTVHFLSKFNYARTNGHNTQNSLRYAIEHVSSALISTSIVLIVGFSVLMFSGFKLNYVLGALSALTIAIALLIDFTLLPAVLSYSEKFSNHTGGLMKTRYASFTTMAIILAIGLSLFSLDTRAGNSIEENKGLWVAQSADEYDAGFINQISKVEMILENSQGQKAVRELRIKILEVENDGDKSLTMFDTPKDVKGTSFLSYSHAREADEQWLYLPSLKRVKRISSNNKSGPFMGSEFAYEDMASQEVDKYSYLYIKEVDVFGGPGHMIERIPVDKNSGYARQVVWIDETHWRISKIDFYDRKNDLLKTLELTGYRQYPNGKWRADLMVMSNHQNQKRTTLLWRDIEFSTNLSSRDFHKNSLKRMR